MSSSDSGWGGGWGGMVVAERGICLPSTAWAPDAHSHVVEKHFSDAVRTGTSSMRAGIFWVL